MKSFLGRHLHIRSGEGGRVAFLCLHYFLISAAIIAGKAARDGFFLSRYDKSLLPLMLLANAGGVSLAVALFSRLSKRLSTRAATLVTLASFAASLLLLEAHLEGWAIPVLYVWVEVIASITVLQAWLLAADVFDPRQAKRLFSLIAAGGSVAAIASGSAFSWFVKAFGSANLLTAVALMLGASALTGLRICGYPVVRPRAYGAPPPQRRRFNPYLTSIALVVAVATVVSAVIQYRFQIAAAEAFPEKDRMVAFFAQFYGWGGAASLATQLLLTGFVLSRLGILVGLLVLPVMLASSSVFTLISPALWSASVGRFSDLTFKFTINSASMELLWLPVPAEERRAAKPFIGGSLKAISEAATGLLMFLAVKSAPRWILSALALGVAAVWIAVAFRLLPLYRRALAAVIQKHQLDAGALRLSAQDPEVVAALEKPLRSGQEGAQLAALGFLEGIPLDPFRESLQELSRTGPEAVRTELLKLAADDPATVPDGVLLETIHEGGELAAVAAGVAASRGLAEAGPLVEGLLESREPRIRASAACALLRLGSDSRARAAAVLGAMLEDADPHAQAEAIERLADNTHILPSARLAAFLRAPVPAVRRAALEVARLRRDQAALPGIIENLEHPRCILRARAALRAFPTPEVVDALMQSLQEAAPRTARKRAALHGLQEHAAGVHEDRVVRFIQWQDVVTYEEFAGVMVAVRKARPLGADTLERISRDRAELVALAYRIIALTDEMPPDQDTILVRDQARHRLESITAIILKLAVLRVPEFPIDTCLHILSSGDASRLPYVQELLESAFPFEERRLLAPLIDPALHEQRKAIYRQRYKASFGGLDELLCLAARSENEWTSVTVLDFLCAARRNDLLARISWDEVPDTELCREVLARRASRDPALRAVIPAHRLNGKDQLAAMYSTLEKTIFLKSVSLFARIPGSELSQLARIAEETRLPAGATLFREGDHGDALYLIATGKVRIEKGGRELATLEKGACLGEMAVLDQAPRSAGAIAIEESTLFRIGQVDLYELLLENPEIMRGIIGLLSRRLREADEKLAGQQVAGSPQPGPA